MKNWPDYADNIHQHLKTAGITSTDLERLMYRNVLDLYGLTQTAPGKNRQRIVDYYSRNGINADWLQLT